MDYGNHCLASVCTIDRIDTVPVAVRKVNSPGRSVSSTRIAGHTVLIVETRLALAVEMMIQLRSDAIDCVNVRARNQRPVNFFYD